MSLTFSTWSVFRFLLFEKVAEARKGGERLVATDWSNTRIGVLLISPYSCVKCRDGPVCFGRPNSRVLQGVVLTGEEPGIVSRCGALPSAPEAGSFAAEPINDLLSISLV